ncbi:hypothetical protein AAVH_13086 [Aphelenchoides avenae]|nr:hypothetical protein AAVH_13086 [Aphelenchus avenae]
MGVALYYPPPPAYDAPPPSYQTVADHIGLINSRRNSDKSPQVVRRRNSCLPPSTTSDSSKWRTFLFCDGTIPETRLVQTDKRMNLYEIRYYRSLFPTRKPDLIVRRGNGSVVGCCKLRLSLLKESHIDLYTNESCSNYITSLTRNGVFTGRYVFNVPHAPHVKLSPTATEPVMMCWKPTTGNSGNCQGRSYKLVDRRGEMVAIYEHVVAAKKHGRLHVKGTMDMLLLDLIVLTLTALIEKNAREDNTKRLLLANAVGH